MQKPNKEDITNQTEQDEIYSALNKYVKAEEHKMNGIYRFFCWCSGARVYIIKKCPTDFNTFFGIGIIILLTGLMATISGSYAFYTVFKSVPLAFVFGIFWGVLIFFLDWYLVSSLKKQNNKKNELLMSIPRFILAFFLGVVISKPIELKLFEKELNNQIASIQLHGSIQNQELIDEEFKEISELKSANENMAIQLKYKESERNKLFQMVITEAEGQSATGTVGKGPVYNEKKQAFDKTEKELTELKQSLSPLITENTQRIRMLQIQRDEKVGKTAQVVENNDGFLARLEAMGELSEKNDRIAMVSLFILILFICIESAPLFVKLISSRGSYDEFLDLENYQRKIEAQRKIAELRVTETKQFKIQDSRTTDEYNIAVATNADFVKKVAEAKTEINAAIVAKWKKEELEKIESNFAPYTSKIENIFGDKKQKEEEPIIEPILKQENTDGSVEEELADKT